MDINQCQQLWSFIDIIGKFFASCCLFISALAFSQQTMARLAQNKNVFLETEKKMSGLKEIPVCRKQEQTKQQNLAVQDFWCLSMPHTAQTAGSSKLSWMPG